MNPNPLLTWTPALFMVVFPIFWCAVLYAIASAGGWRQLAKRYRCSAAIFGTVWRFQSATVHNFADSNYGGCVKVTANEEGIGLSVFFPFRVGHPPLFIPWSEILVSELRRFIFFDRVRFTFPGEPSIWIEISSNLAAKIQTALGCDWFPDVGL